MQNRTFPWIICCSLILLVVHDLSAQSLSLRTSTSFYAWENQFVDSTYESARSLRAFQSIVFDAREVMPSISVHGFVRGMVDLGAEAGENPDYRVYNLYARWTRSVQNDRRWDIRLGRQHIFTSARSVNADAIRVEFVQPSSVSMMAFFGSLPSADGHVGILKPFERRAWGGKVYTSAWGQTNAAVSFIDKHRDGPFYLTESASGGDSLVLRPDLEERLASLDVHRAFTKYVNWYAHVDYDFLQSEVQKMSTDIQTHITPELDVSVLYAYRRPRVFESTIFGAFGDAEENQEIWMRASYRIDHHWTAGAEYANVFYKLKDAWRWGGFVSYDRVSAHYMRRLGYGGTMSGFALSAYHPVTSRIGVTGSLSYYTFELGDDITSTMVVDPISRQVLDNVNTSLTGVLRAQVQVTRSVAVDAEGQCLSQNLKSSPVYGGQKADWRLFVRANYWIFNRW